MQKVDWLTIGALVCYVASVLVMLAVGCAQPGGPFTIYGIAGLMTSAGGLSPFLWMMQWFRAEMFTVRDERPLRIDRSMRIVVLGVSAVTTAVFVTIVGQQTQ